MDILTPEPVPVMVGLFSFALPFFLLVKVLLPRINKVLAERQDAIEGTAERAGKTALEAAETLAEYRRELAEARHEAARIRQEFMEQGAELLAGIRAEGLREREALITEGQARLAADRVIAETELRGDIVSLATELAGRIVGEPLAGVAGDSDVVDRFFAELDADGTTSAQSA